MCPLFFAYDHQNYVEYLSVYHLTLVNIEETHPGERETLEKYGFSISRSDLPGTRNAIDITIKQTINRLKQEFCSLLQGCLTQHPKASYVEATFDLANMSTSESDVHKDTIQASKTATEADVESIIRSFDNFVNPFKVDNKDVLFCVSSGSPLPNDTEKDLLDADKIGTESHQRCVTDCLVEKSVSLHMPFTKNRN